MTAGVDRRRFLALAGATAAATAAAVAFPAVAGARGSSLPVVGTCSLTAAQYDATRAHAAVRMPVNVTYQAIGEPFDAALASALAKRGVTHQVITVEMWAHGNQVLHRISRGELDGQLRRLAGEMARWSARHPAVELILRPLHEADGGSRWGYPWCFGGGFRGNRPADFPAAWARVHAVTRSVLPGLRFAWSPNGCPTAIKGAYAHWYPGDGLVDYVAPDYYNRSQSDGGWRTPTQLWSHTLTEIRRVSRRPILITETATSEPRHGVKHSKPEWYGQFGRWLRTDAVAAGVVGVCCFDRDLTRRNGNDWRIATTTASRDAFRRAVRGLS